jgi:hypothetical protein
MVIKYTNTPDEIAENLIYRRTHSEQFAASTKSTRRLFAMFCGMLGIYVVYEAYLFFSASSGAASTAAGSRIIITALIIAALLAFMRFVPKLQQTSIRREAKKVVSGKDFKTSELTLTVSDNSISWQDGSGGGTAKLTEKHSITETADAWMIDINKPAAHLSVPKRIFTSAEETAQFKQLLGISSSGEIKSNS